jgi:hypothetical protein
MTPPDEPVIKRDSDPPPIQKVRTKEPQAPLGQDEPDPNVVSDATAEDKAPGEAVVPGIGGYGERDPEHEMPRVPTAPETQDDGTGDHGDVPPSPP